MKHNEKKNNKNFLEKVKKKYLIKVTQKNLERTIPSFTVSWVTRPERPKGVKDVIEQARRAQSRPKVPQPRSQGSEGP